MAGRFDGKIKPSAYGLQATINSRRFFFGTKGVKRLLSSRDQQHGFSLIELLIVVTIILILAAIAIPNLLRSKIAANEASAGASLRQSSTANAIYSTIYNVGYAGTLAALGPIGGACASVSSACADLLDSVVSGVNPATPTPVKSGYKFTYYSPAPMPTMVSPNQTFGVVAVPIIPNSSGLKTFCVDHSKDLRQDPTGGLTAGAATGCVGWP